MIESIQKDSQINKPLRSLVNLAVVNFVVVTIWAGYWLGGGILELRDPVPIAFAVMRLKNQNDPCYLQPIHPRQNSWVQYSSRICKQPLRSHADNDPLARMIHRKGWLFFDQMGQRRTYQKKEYKHLDVMCRGYGFDYEVCSTSRTP